MTLATPHQLAAADTAARRVRQERVMWLATVLLWTLVLLVAAGCNPPPADVPTSGAVPADPVVRIAAADAPVLVDGDRFHPTTTSTVVPATTVVPQPVTTAAPAPAPQVAPEPAGSVWDGEGRLGDPYYLPTWHALRECEAPDWSGGWQANTGNGFFGGLQFTLQSWRWVGGAGYPHEASVDEQIRRGQMLWERQGWGAWPTCSRKLGWR